MAIKTTDEFVIPISVKDEVTAKLREIEKSTKSLLSTMNGASSDKLGSGLANTAKNFSKLTGEASKASSQVSIFGMTLGKVSSTIFIANSYLDFFNRTVRTFSVTVGGAVKPAMELEAGLAKISTVVPDASGSMNQFKQDILGFQKLYGSEQADLIKGYYDLLQSGAVESADATAVMATAQKMAVAGFSTTDKMITGLIAVLATYNMKASDTIRIADLMAIANKNGQVTIEGLAENIGQVAGLAKAMNISLEESFSAISTISMATNNSAEAMTAFRAIITGMSKQTGEFTGVLSRLGYTSIQAMVAQKGFLGTLKALTGEAGMSVEALSDIFGRVESQVALNMLLSERTQKNYITSMNQMQEGLKNIGAETDAMLYKAMDNTDRKMKILKGSVYALFASLGESLLEPIKDSVDTLISTVYDFETKIRDLTNAYKDLIKDQEKVNQLLTIFGEIVASIAIGALIANFTAVTAAIGGFIATLASAYITLLPIALIGAAIMAVAVAIEVVYKNWDLVVAAFDIGMKQIESWWLSLKMTVFETSNSIVDGLNKIGIVSDSVANTLRLNTNKDAEAQANLNSEINKSSANFNNLLKNFKGPAIYEYFSKSTNAVERFSDKLSEAQNYARLVGEAINESDLTKFTPVIPEQKTPGMEINRADISKFMPLDDTVLAQYKAAYNKAQMEHKEYLDAVALATKKFREKGYKDENGDLAKSILSAEEKYRSSLRDFEEFWFKEIKKSSEEVFDIEIKADFKFQPNMQSYKKLEKEYQKFLETTEAMEKSKGQLGFGIKQKKQDLDMMAKLYQLSQQTLKGGNYMGYQVKSVELAKQDLDIARQAYNISVNEADTVEKTIFARKAAAIAYEQMLEDAKELTKYEQQMADIKESGGAAIFNAEQLQLIEKVFGAKKSDFEFTYKNVTDNPMEAMSAGMQNVGASITGGLSSFTSFMSGPMGMVAAAGMILDGLTQMVNAIADLPQKVASLLQAVNDLPSKVIKGLNNIIKEVGRSIAELPGQVLDMVGVILDFFPDLLTKIFDSLVELMGTDFFKKVGENLVKFALLIPRMLVTAITGLTKLIPAIFKNIPKMLKDFVKGMLTGLMEFANEIAHMLGMKDFFKIKIDEKAIKKMAEKFSNSAQQMFSVTDIEPKKLGVNLMDKINAAMDKLNDMTGGLWLKFLALLKEIWLWVYNTILYPIISLLKDAWLWIWDTILYPIYSIIKDAWMWVYDKIIKPLSDNIMRPFIWVYDHLLKPVFDDFVDSLTEFVDNLKKTWDIIVSGFDAIWSGFKTYVIEPLQVVWNFLYDHVVAPIKGVFNMFIESLNDIFIKPLAGFIAVMKGVWDGVVDFFTVKWVTTLGDSIGKAATKFVDYLATGIQHLLDNLNPLNLFNKMFDSSGAYGHKGTVEKALNFDMPYMAFAEGGNVPGRAKVSGDSSLNDNILALLSPGEAVIPRSLMNNPKVAAIIDALLSGQLNLPKFSWGGTIGGAISSTFKDVASKAQDVVSPILEAVSNLADPLWDVVREKGFDWIWKMFEANKFHTGGLVGFSQGGEVPATLQSGEFVMNRNAVGSLGTNFLNSLNSGGSVGSSPVFNITINAKTYLDQDAIKREILPTIERELKRKSLDGSFIIAASGIRK